MTRAQLEHVLRAAGALTDELEIVILGSQAILASFPEAPEELHRSMEADAFPLGAPEKADLIDGSIGELSPFHETYGYYAHGILPESAALPTGWRERLVRVLTPATQGVTGLCLAPEDLAASKLAAGREKDLDFVAALLRHGLVAITVLRTRVSQLPAEHASNAATALAGCERRAGKGMSPTPASK
jgi:hypothetical protein